MYGRIPKHNASLYAPIVRVLCECFLYLTEAQKRKCHVLQTYSQSSIGLEITPSNVYVYLYTFYTNLTEQKHKKYCHTDTHTNHQGCAFMKKKKRERGKNRSLSQPVAFLQWWPRPCCSVLLCGLSHSLSWQPAPAATHLCPLRLPRDQLALKFQPEPDLLPPHPQTTPNHFSTHVPNSLLGATFSFNSAIKGPVDTIWLAAAIVSSPCLEFSQSLCCLCGPQTTETVLQAPSCH